MYVCILGMVESLNVSVSVAVSCARAREAAGRDGDGSAADAAALSADYERRGKEHQFMKHNKLKQKAEDATQNGGHVVVEAKKDKETRRAEFYFLNRVEADRVRDDDGTATQCSFQS